MSVTTFAEQDPASGYSLSVEIDGLGNESAGTAAVTHVLSETPNYAVPVNPNTVKKWSDISRVLLQ